jgi:hypothetical protein
MTKLSMSSASGCVFLLFGSLHPSYSFVGQSALYHQRFHMVSASPFKQWKPIKSISMTPDDFDMDLASGLDEALPLLLDQVTPWILQAEDPTVEAGLLTGMAHVMLDFSGFVNPSKRELRLFALIGRLLVLSADYLPDHLIKPEELVVQLFLLSITMKELVEFGMKVLKMKRRL